MRSSSVTRERPSFRAASERFLAEPPRARRGLFYAWSALGVADILLALGSANFALLVLRDPRMLEQISTTHYQLLPTFLVPLVILTHLYTLVRVRAARRA